MWRIKLVFVILITACRTSYCPDNKIYIEKFNRSLDLIISAEEKNIEVSVENYRDALLFLSNTTGILTKAEYSSTIGYRTKEDYKKNIKSWKKWLQKNKCKLTEKYVESVMAVKN